MQHKNGLRSLTNIKRNLFEKKYIFIRNNNNNINNKDNNHNNSRWEL